MNILELVHESHSLAKEKGFWDQEKNSKEDIMLIIANLGDVIKAYKKKKHSKWDLFSDSFYNDKPTTLDNFNPEDFNAFIKDSFEDEISNVILRVTDFIGGYKIDMAQNHPWIKDCLHVDLNTFFSRVAPSEKYSNNIGDWMNKSIKECVYNSNEEDHGCLHMLFYLGSIIEHFGINIEKHLLYKIAFNKSRPHLYGRSY